jgi:hypothetical protein
MVTLPGFIISGANNITSTNSITTRPSYATSVASSYSNLNITTSTTAITTRPSYATSLASSYSNLNNTNATTDIVTKPIYWSSMTIIAAALVQSIPGYTIPTVGQIYPLINGSNNY